MSLQEIFIEEKEHLLRTGFVRDQSNVPDLSLIEKKLFQELKMIQDNYPPREHYNHLEHLENMILENKFVCYETD
jgi:hypothetical protein